MRGRVSIAAASLLLILAAAAIVVNITPTSSYFSDTETVEGHLSAGTWGGQCQPRITCVCPNWGPCGACSWAVFIHGSNLGQIKSVQLVKGGTVITAKKAWLIGSCLIYAVFDLRSAATGLYDVRVSMVNGEAVLKEGFKVTGWCCRLTNATRKYPAGEDKLRIGKRLYDDKQRSIAMTIEGQKLGQVESACLLAPGYIQQLEVKEKGNSSIVLVIDAVSAPLADCDLVLTTGDGWNLLLEKAITVLDLRLTVRITQIHPARAVAEGVVEVQVKGDGVRPESELRLRMGSTELRAVDEVVWEDGKAACRFDLSQAPPGIYDLVVVDAYGVAFTLPGCFTVSAAGQEPTPEDDGDGGGDNDDGLEEGPGRTSPVQGLTIRPTGAHAGSIVDVVIEGGPFASPMRARLKGAYGGAWATQPSFPASRRMECRFDLRGLPVGDYALEVLDQQGTVLCTGIFEVL